MGFSVSGSAAIVFAGMFIAFGMFYTATSNGFEQVSDARSESAEDMLEQQNTDLNVTTVHYEIVTNGSNYLVVGVNNTGSTELAIEDTDLLLDNDYYGERDWTAYNVSGDESTSLWLPGETLWVNVSGVANPDRVKVVTGPGVADEEVN